MAAAELSLKHGRGGGGGGGADGSAADRTWLKITVAGTTAGLAVAAATYAATNMAARTAATTTGLTLDVLGDVAAYGTKALFGDLAALSVKVVSKTVAKTSEESIRYGGTLSAAAVAAAAGAATALTVTVGTHVVSYSIEYGGKLSREMAQRFSEAYLQYKARHSQFVESGNVQALEDGEWVVLDTDVDPTTLQMHHAESLADGAAAAATGGPDA